MNRIRKDHEPPEAISKWGWKFHHIGVPTTEKMPDELYISKYRFYISGFESCPFGIEWMRFEEDSPILPLIQKVPHLAFEVKDIDAELIKHNFKIITKPNSPSIGVKVAMIEHNGAPIELIEFTSN
jgi:hypothetical protein